MCSSSVNQRRGGIKCSWLTRGFIKPPAAQPAALRLVRLALTDWLLTLVVSSCSLLVPGLAEDAAATSCFLCGFGRSVPEDSPKLFLELLFLFTSCRFVLQRSRVDVHLLAGAKCCFS